MEAFIPYQIALILAGIIYIITLGPVFLAIISLVSESDRKTGFKFISGAIFGCMIWLSFTCASLIEADRLPKILFMILALACASYLFFLGGKMIVKSIGKKKQLLFERPVRDGFIMALLNPKSYPVMVSVFGSIVIQYPTLLSWEHFIEIFILSATGFALGYCLMVLMASLPLVKRFYTNHLRSVSIAFGAIFIFFGINILLNAF